MWPLYAPLGFLTAWWLGPDTKLPKRQEVVAARLLRPGPRDWLRVKSMSFYWSEQPQPTQIQERRRTDPTLGRRYVKECKGQFLKLPQILNNVPLKSKPVNL